jgi:hypothetical protein
MSAQSQVLPEQRDTRPRLRRLAPVIAVGMTGLLATSYVALVDPESGGHYPACPTQLFFGIDCPGCGGIRSAHSLLRGDVAAAIDYNLAALVLIPLAVIALITWARRSWSGITPAQSMKTFQRKNRWLLIGVIALVVFGVIRNFIPYLGSGLYPG